MGLASFLLDSTRAGRPPEMRLADGLAGTAGESTSLRDLLDRDHERAGGSAAAMRCVNAIAVNAASVPVVVERNGEVTEDHEVARLFDRPNPYMSGVAFRQVLFSRAEWRGESFVFLDRGPTGTGPATAAYLVYGRISPVVRRGPGGDHDPALIAAVEGSDDVLEGYLLYGQNGRRFGLLPSEVLWLRYPHPDDPWRALAPWKSAVHAADLDAWAREWQKAELITGGGGSSIVYLGDLEEDAFRAAKAAWRTLMSGPRSSNRHYLTAGPTPSDVKTLGATAVDLALIESRRWNLEETCLAFGVPKDYILGGSTFDNQRTAKTSLWSDTILGKMRLLSSEADRQLLPDPREAVAFDVSEVDALRESEDAQVGRLARLLATDALTLDEAREERGLDPLPGGLGAMTLSAYRAAVSGRPAPVDAEPRAVLAGRRRDTLLITGRGIRRLDRPRPSAPLTVPAATEGRASTIPVAAVLRAYDRHETAGRRAVARLAEQMEKAVLRAFKKATGRARVGDTWIVRSVDGDALQVAVGPDDVREVRISATDLLDPAFWTGKTRDALESWMAALHDDGASTAANRLGVDFDTFQVAVLDRMAERLDVLAGQITDTTYRAISEGVLADGVAEGKSIADLADDLKTVFTDLTTWRAETIARTETVGGFNASARVVAVGSGVVVARRWMATSDGRVRDTHADLDGYRTAGLDDAYPNGVMFPGDPAGRPAETINCRCAEEYVLDDEQED